MNISLVHTSHQFQKQNLVTQTSNRRSSYDTYKCANCGLEGFRFGLSNELDIADKKKNKNANAVCPNSDAKPPRIVVIGYVLGVGSEFDDLTPGKIAPVIPPPNSYAEKFPNSPFSVWVKGKTAPVRLLGEEFFIAKNLSEAMKIATELKDAE